MNPCPQDPVLLVHSRLRLKIKTTRNSKSIQTNKFPLAIPKARRSLGRSRHRTRKMPCLQFAQPHRHLPGRIDGQPGSLAMAGPPISPNPHRRHPATERSTATEGCRLRLFPRRRRMDTRAEMSGEQGQTAHLGPTVLKQSPFDGTGPPDRPNRSRPLVGVFATSRSDIAQATRVRSYPAVHTPNATHPDLRLPVRSNQLSQHRRKALRTRPSRPPPRRLSPMRIRRVGGRATDNCVLPG